MDRLVPRSTRGPGSRLRFPRRAVRTSNFLVSSPLHAYGTLTRRTARTSGRPRTRSHPAARPRPRYFWADDRRDRSTWCEPALPQRKRRLFTKRSPSWPTRAVA